MKRSGSIAIFAILLAACSSPAPTLSLPPTLEPTTSGAESEESVVASSTVALTEEAAEVTPTPLRETATPAPTPTPPSDAVACPLTGLDVSEAVLAERRPLQVQLGNSNPERPQFGLQQADMVFETLSEGGITRFTAMFLCQDAAEIAGIRSGRLINLQTVPMFDAIFVHVGASGPVQKMFEDDIRIRDSSLDFFRNHPGFVLQPERRRAPFDIFASTDSLFAAAGERNIEIPGQPLPEFLFDPAAPSGGISISSATIRHHSSYWVRWKWDSNADVWTRHLSNENNPDRDSQFVDAATGQTLTTKNILIIRAIHRQTDMIEDSLGSRSVEVELLGSGEAWFLRDGQLYEGSWARDELSEWFDLTLYDGSSYVLAPGNTYIHFYQPGLPLDTTE